ncbi:MAG: hypothetical protein IBX45_02585 [Campylobacterales bacterium]|nr:hypothetical protein [Campylobacterales bacterium]
MRKVTIAILAVVMGLVFAGCRTTALYNVEKAPVVASSNKKLTAQDTEKAIMRAGGRLGWVMKKVENGHIEGTLNIRKHMAAVSIRYTANEYSINYLNSSSLNYDPATSTIHQNYNGWVQNLDNAIRVQLSML